MRAWELLGLDEGTQQAGSQQKDSNTLDSKKQLKQVKPKRVKPIEPEKPFSLKIGKRPVSRHQAQGILGI